MKLIKVDYFFGKYQKRLKLQISSHLGKVMSSSHERSSVSNTFILRIVCCAILTLKRVSYKKSLLLAQGQQ